MSCPALEALEALLAGQPEGPVAAHVDECAHCQARLEELASVANRTGPAEWSTGDLGPECEPPADFLHRLQQTPPVEARLAVDEGDTPVAGLR
jgi:hypothetical protein